ncbi:Spo0E family sporulation regulatory protein-aspartic acid phosphatase [Peptostreptococcus stomatis]|nr:Spo0E family sporulation regulatory protein-aspartic acid phosphatase [Peptostreptococcus stomatis]
MYKLLKEILKELKGIRKELHVIATNTKPLKLTESEIISISQNLDTLKF